MDGIDADLVEIKRMAKTILPAEAGDITCEKFSRS